jgi:tetratricopeptide (TPR) repeat protein
MKGWRAAIGFAVIAIAVFSENLFGREFNNLFLRLPGIDKVLHFTEYFAIFLVIFWLAGRVTQNPRQRAAAACGAGLLLAVTDEFTQRLVTDRNFELFDLAANVAGLTLGWIVTTRPRLRVAVPATVAALGTAAFVAYSTHVKLADYAKALQHERRHEFAQAREYYLRALAKGLRTPAIHNELAWVTVESRGGTGEEAVHYARLAYDAQPENPDVLDTYGWALHYAGRSREALPLLEEAFKRNPEIYCIHYHLAEVYVALARPDLAEPHFLAQIARRGTREAPLAEQSLARLKAAAHPTTGGLAGPH